MGGEEEEEEEESAAAEAKRLAGELRGLKEALAEARAETDAARRERDALLAAGPHAPAEPAAPPSRQPLEEQLPAGPSRGKLLSQKMRLQADAYTIEKHRRRAQRLLEELARRPSQSAERPPAELKSLSVN